MAEAALFIGWGEPARGREMLANRDICGPHYDRAADISAELRLFLVGIIAEVLKRDVDEPIRDSSERVINAEDLADVSRRPIVRKAQVLNLGVAFNSQAIVGTLNVALSAAAEPPGQGEQDYS